MSFLSEIFNDVINFCCPVLQPNRQDHPNIPTIQQPLIQMQIIDQKIKQLNQFKKNSRKRTASYHQRISAPQSMQDVQQFHDNSLKMIQSLSTKKNKISNQSNNYPEKQQSSEKPQSMRRVQSKTLRNSQRKSGSQSSFQTIKSTASRPISRRNFKLLRKQSSFFGKHRQKKQDDDFYSVNQSQNSSMDQHHIHKIINYKYEDNKLNSYDGVDLINQWIKKEYEKYPNKLYKPNLNQITKMKLQTKDAMDSIVHKLQDYYTFYYEDEQLSSSSNIMGQNIIGSTSGKFFLSQPHQTHFYQSQDHKILCSVTKTDYTKSLDGHKNCKYMSLIILPHCALPPIKFLQWFNQIQIQSRLHSFNKIQYLQNSQRINDKIVLEYPLVKAQQFNERLLGKINYLLVREIEVVKFQFEDDRQTLLQMCFQAASQNNYFDRLVRITAEGNQGCRVEIYIQSSQNIISKHSAGQTGNKEGRQKHEKQFSTLLSKKTESLNVTDFSSVKKQKNQFNSPNKNRYNNETNAGSKKGNQDRKDYQFEYFQQKWIKFQQSLNKDYIINKKQHQVFQN